MFGFGKRKGPILGLDINSDSITLLQLEKTRSGIEVARFACQPTPANSVREGLVAEPELVGEVVIDLMNEAGLLPSGQTPVLNVVVPAQAVVIRLMPVPVGMPEDELADVVTQEATNHVPFPIHDANLDWAVMPATERTDFDGVRRVDVILAAIQRSIVESYWRMTDAAGARLGRVEVSSLAVIRSLALSGYLGSSGHLSMIVNMRQDATDINIVRSCMPLFGRSVMLGVETMTEAVARSLDMPFDQALDMLPEISLFSPAPNDPRMGQAAQVARTIFSDIADELAKSLEFYRSQVGDVKMDQIVLAGPGCMVPGLDQFFFNKLNVRSVISDPMRDIKHDETEIVDRMRPILAALVGSAIEPSWNPAYTVDLDLNKEGRVPLLFDERATQTMTKDLSIGPPVWQKPALIFGSALLMMFLAAYAVMRFIDLPQKETEIETLSNQIMIGKQQLKTLTSERQENTVLSARKRVLNALLKKHNRWSSLLSELTIDTPQGVQIDRIMLRGKDMKVEGIAIDFNSVSNLAINLGGSLYLKDSQVDWITREEKTPEVFVFSISAKLSDANAAGPPKSNKASRQFESIKTGNSLGGTVPPKLAENLTTQAENLRGQSNAH
ncbi:MAG: type IV pilus assembly protein PilM [Candidatus Melainabacteria bacterium]|nr:type IV pilus assembly protein PilM [Candidatus Melainabacteria bacterium]